VTVLPGAAEFEIRLGVKIDTDVIVTSATLRVITERMVTDETEFMVIVFGTVMDTVAIAPTAVVVWRTVIGGNVSVATVLVAWKLVEKTVTVATDDTVCTFVVCKV